MESYSHPPAEPPDAKARAAQWSKVSKKTPGARSYRYWLMGGVLAVVVVFFSSSHHMAPQKMAAPNAVQSMDYQSALNANLAHLETLEHTKAVLRSASSATQLPSYLHVAPSKAYLARQNAPTSQYAASMDQHSTVTPHSSVSTATLIGQGANAQWANTRTHTASVEAMRLPHPDKTVAAGEFMHAVLETAISSDLPGRVRAVVSKPVYSYSGARTLIPAGSRLIGQYASHIVQGQERVMIIWNRVLLPNGIAIQIQSPSTDALGRGGQGANYVNTHFLARFGESALLSLIGAGAATVGVNDADQYNSAAQYRMAIAQSFQTSAQQSLQGSLPMQPTLHIHQGTQINVFVAQDISFYRVLGSTPDLPTPMPTVGRL